MVWYTRDLIYVRARDARHRPTAACWGWSVDIHRQGREVLSFIEQATLPLLILPFGNGAKEDELACDAIHRFSAHGVLTFHVFNRFELN